MSTLEPVRYEQGRPMLLAGIRRHHTFAEHGEGYPAPVGRFPEARAVACAGRHDGVRRDLRRRSQDPDDGVHVRGRGARASTRCRRSSAACVCPPCATPCSCTKATWRTIQATWQANLFDVAAEFRHALGEYAGLRAVRRALRRRHGRRRRRDLARASSPPIERVGGSMRTAMALLFTLWARRFACWPRTTIPRRSATTASPLRSKRCAPSRARSSASNAAGSSSRAANAATPSSGSSRPKTMRRIRPS